MVSAKEKALEYMKSMPDLIKAASDQIKKHFDADGKELIEGTTGVLGLIIKFFGKNWIENYFQKVQTNKLEGFGYATYLSAGFVQAEKSLEEIKDAMPSRLSKKAAKDAIGKIEKSLQYINEKLTSDQLYLVFQPNQHPAIKLVRESYKSILRDLGIELNTIEKFQKHFNGGVENTIKEAFGEVDYQAHLKDVEQNWLTETEIRFLEDIQKLKRIGFVDNENLPYETTFAKWQKVENFRSIDDDKEEDLRPIDELIEEYFKEGEDHNEKILFVVADFGKGKSVFLRSYAAELADTYLRTGDGMFPVYFNLAEYGRYCHESPFGVISNYLVKKYAIDIADSYYKKKTYMFLIDSLDESGELNQRHVDAVIESIQRVQKIDEVKSRRNRLVITTRPIDDGLQRHLSLHAPMTIIGEEQQRESQFISIHGFKKSQFNHWLITSLTDNQNFDKLSGTGNEFIKDLLNGIRDSADFDVHNELTCRQILAKDELRRPIFAYMLYKLILGGKATLSNGRIGIYLSFLNMLTREAKCKYDNTCSTNLKDEFRFRNILHITAALWLYQRHNNNITTIRKEDICRMIERCPMEARAALEKYSEINDLKFLSHSYFGEDGNNMKFQHQSFAEILLAEYYLKIFLKYALDEGSNILDAKVRLTIGEPTHQAMQFFRELLNLLRESVSDEVTPVVIEKRKLLFPFIASLGISDYSCDLFSNRIHYLWYQDLKLSDSEYYIKDKHVIKWPINNAVIGNLIGICKSIIESDMDCLIMQAESGNALIDKEVLTVRTDRGNVSRDIDRWIALLVGNMLYNDIDTCRYFSSLLTKHLRLLQMMERSSNYQGLVFPPWLSNNNRMGVPLLSFARGSKIGEADSGYTIRYCNFSGVDFSFSSFTNISFYYCNFGSVSFNSCKMKNIELSECIISRASFRDIEICGPFILSLCIIGQNLIIPFPLYLILSCINNKDIDDVIANFGSDITYLSKSNMGFADNNEFNHLQCLDGLFECILKYTPLNKEDILKWFVFEREKDSSEFLNYLRSLESLPDNKDINDVTLSSIKSIMDFIPRKLRPGFVELTPPPRKRRSRKS